MQNGVSMPLLMSVLLVRQESSQTLTPYDFLSSRFYPYNHCAISARNTFFAACLLSFNYRRIYNIAPSAPRELAALDNDLEYRELEAVNERGYSSMMQVPIIVDCMINHHWSLEIYSSLRHRVFDSAN